VPIWMLYPRERYGSYVDVHTLPSYRPLMPYIWQDTDWFDRRDIATPPFFTKAARVDVHTNTCGGWTVTRQTLHTPHGDLTAEHRQDTENAAGATTEHFCKDIADLEKVLAIPYEPVDPDLSSFHSAARKLGDAGLMMANLTMPIGVAYGLTHPETFAIWTLTERETLVRFTRAMFERTYRFLEQALEEGAGPVFFTIGSEFLAPPMGSPVAFDALVAPFDGPLIDLIHRFGGKVIVHHHGNINAILERIADLGADAIQPIEEPPVGDCTMADAKRRIGSRTKAARPSGGAVCIVGSVQYDDFARLTPDAMEDLVKRQISDAALGGGMILAPTAGPYAAHLTQRQQQNILRFIQAGRTWGRYPLSWL